MKSKRLDRKRGPQKSRATRRTRHNALIEALVKTYPEIRTTGFANAIRKAVGPEDAAESAELIASVRPDAYAVHSEEMEIVAFEVEDRHHLSETKIFEYGRLYFLLQEEGWGLGLIRVSAWGECTACDLLTASIRIAINTGEETFSF